MLRRSSLSRIEREVKQALRGLEEKERRVHAIRGKLERVYSKLPPLLKLLELARPVDRGFYGQFYPMIRMAHSEAMELAVKLDELQSAIEVDKEKLQRLLALIQILKERGRKGKRWFW